jgi:hypothetical protein
MKSADLKSEGGSLMNREKVKVFKSASGYSQVVNSNRKARIILYACLVMLVMLIMPLTHISYASEGGTSSFTPGAQGDFGLNYYPQGLYFRENIVYTSGKLDKYPAATFDTEAGPVAVNADLEAKVWFNLFQIVYSSNVSILGGRYFANMNIPIGIDANLKGEGYIPAAPEAGIIDKQDITTTGLGDIQVVPFGIVWDKGNLHFLFAQNLVLNTGRYNALKSNNMGRNYFSYDEVVGVTWLDETNGHEASFMAGYMINTKNQATDYKTGNEFHVDYTLAQFLSKQFGLGVVGYYYKQVTDDESPTLDSINTINKAMGLATPGGYKSKGAAVGPAVIFTPNIVGHDVNLIAKWLHEFSMDNRLEGEWVWLSAVVKF